MLHYHHMILHYHALSPVAGGRERDGVNCCQPAAELRADAAAHITTRTLTRVGSITKTFTALLTFQANDRPRHAQPRSARVPKFTPHNPWDGARAAWRQLASHSSGLPRDMDYNQPTTSVALRQINQWSLAFSPGRVFLISRSTRVRHIRTRAHAKKCGSWGQDPRRRW